MAHAELHDNVIVVTAAYHENDLVTQLPGSRHKTKNLWSAPLSWATCITLRGLFGELLEVGPELKKWAWREHNERIEPILELRESLELTGPRWTLFNDMLDDLERESELKLKPYQRADVAFLVTSRQALLANSMGLGKTVVAIRSLQMLRDIDDVLPALVVCPNSLKYTVWAKEFAQWAPEFLVQVIDGSIASRRKQLKTDADVYILNWDLLRIHSRLAPYGAVRLTPEQRNPKELNELGHKTIIMDEAHRLGNVGSVKSGEGRIPRSQQAQAAWAVAHQAKVRFAFTGTPIADHVGDLWGLEHGVLPDWFPARTRYLDRYAQVTLSYWGGSEIVGLNPATEEEFHRIVDPTFRRIPKELALPQLPPKLPVQYRYTPMTPKQEKMYRQMEEEMLAVVDSGDYIAAPTDLAQLTRLLQFAASCAEINEDGKVRLTTPSNKINDLVELLAEMGDEPLAVAAVSKQLINLAAAKLTELGITHGLITGDQSAWERQEAVTAFQAGRLRVILFTLGAGGEGITLTRTDTLVFMQESFRQLENVQAMGRIDRIGAECHNVIQYIKQITPETVEQRKIEILKGKAGRIEEVLRDRDTLRRMLGARN